MTYNVARRFFIIPCVLFFVEEESGCLVIKMKVHLWNFF